MKPRASAFPACAAPQAKASAFAPAQPELFDTDISLPWSKGFLRVGEVAKFLDVSEDQVLRLIDVGELESISIAASPAEAARHHRRVTGRSVAALVNRRRKVVV